MKVDKCCWMLMKVDEGWWDHIGQCDMVSICSKHATRCGYCHPIMGIQRSIANAHPYGFMAIPQDGTMPEMLTNWSGTNWGYLSFPSPAFMIIYGYLWIFYDHWDFGVLWGCNSYRCSHSFNTVLGDVDGTTPKGLLLDLWGLNATDMVNLHFGHWERYRDI